MAERDDLGVTAAPSLAARDWHPGVGMPARLKLEQFGQVLFEAFGTAAYLVGSAARGKEWRDVDVRVILDDDEFEKQIGELRRPRCLNVRWNALCLAFAALGRDMTGLPIDFQIDQQTQANEQYDYVRVPLGTPYRLASQPSERNSARVPNQVVEQPTSEAGS